ncbi:MAG TPA: hypothetical protein VF721_12160 [Pyrinomonadaceae bacterium]|jgi:hypothetical protein
MNVSFHARLASLILLIGSTSACLNPYVRFGKQENYRQQQVSPEMARRMIEKEKAEEQKLVEMYKSREFDLDTEIGKVTSHVFEELNKENFALLEQEAGKARKEKQRVVGGFWKIRTIYEGLSEPVNKTDEEWKKHFARLNRWKEKFPESITPRIALAESWVGYAWTARGNGYSYTISEESGRLYDERLMNAVKELIEAKKLNERCPHWYAVMLLIARAQGWDYDEFEAVYREAVKFEPHYYYYALRKGTYLLPRWHGEPGDWEDFVEQAARETGGTEGAILYYLIASDYITDYADMTFDSTKLSVEKAKQGYYTLKKTYGADKRRLNEFAKFACRTNDLAAANEAFEEIGDNWVQEIWHSKQAFLKYKNIAANAKNQNQPPQHQPQAKRF